ncbi:MAG: hypothetical protein HYZ81_04745, partial [Nitrospinae bacterium]|nr:hypothetical protein [Nitrospinota bacterium]
QRFAAKFSEATGIAVHLEAASNIRINDRLGAEVFQIVAEGLSNVRRHTSSTQATVALACVDGQLVLRIADAGGAPTLHPALDHGTSPGTGWACARGGGPGP